MKLALKNTQRPTLYLQTNLSTAIHLLKYDDRNNQREKGKENSQKQNRKKARREKGERKNKKVKHGTHQGRKKLLYEKRKRKREIKKTKHERQKKAQRCEHGKGGTYEARQADMKVRHKSAERQITNKSNK